MYDVLKKNAVRQRCVELLLNDDRYLYLGQNHDEIAFIPREWETIPWMSQGTGKWRSMDTEKGVDGSKCVLRYILKDSIKSRTDGMSLRLYVGPANDPDMRDNLISYCERNPKLGQWPLFNAISARGEIHRQLWKMSIYDCDSRIVKDADELFRQVKLALGETEALRKAQLQYFMKFKVA